MDEIEIDLLLTWSKLKFYVPRIVLFYLVMRGSWSFYLAMLDLPDPNWGLWIDFFTR